MTNHLSENDELEINQFIEYMRPYYDKWVKQGGRNVEMQHGALNFITGQGFVMLNDLLRQRQSSYAVEVLKELSNELGDIPDDLFSYSPKLATPYQERQALKSLIIEAIKREETGNE